MTEKTFPEESLLTFTYLIMYTVHKILLLTVQKKVKIKLFIFHLLLSFEWIFSDLEVVVRRQFFLSRYYVNMDIGIYEALGVEGGRMSLKWYCEERKYVAVSFITHI